MPSGIYPKPAKKSYAYEITSLMPIAQGNIIHGIIQGISHGKFFIIVSIPVNQVTVAIVFINSGINPNLFPTAELKQLHLPVLKSNYSFLTHDSYIDCSDINEMNYSEIDNYVAHNKGCNKGNLSTTDLKAVLALLSSSRKITPKQKIKYGI